MNDNHPVLKFLALTAALELNNQHNARMLAEGRYIPWWKRHLLFVIIIAVASPVLLIGAFIVAVNVFNPSAAVMGDLGTFSGWAIPIGGVLLIVVSYFRAEQRWRRDVHKPTKVIEVRRGQ